MTLATTQPLAWLVAWFRAHCDGDWEHQNGIQIGTLDNPGWSLDVDLGGTEHEGRTVAPELTQRSDEDWVFIEVKDATFHARGGAGNLEELISLFARFIEDGSR